MEVNLEHFISKLYNSGILEPYNFFTKQGQTLFVFEPGLNSRVNSGSLSL